MSLVARLSILGLYNYDNTIFDDFNVPEGMDKEVAIETILSECNDLEVIYPSVESMKVAIRLWTMAELPLWQRMKDVADAEYNPIWNVDGSEKRVIETHGTNSGTSSEESTASGENESIDSVKGYNESAWAESTKNNGTATNTAETSGETAGEHHEVVTDTFTRGGNIGVTSSQSLVTQELEVVPKLDIYKYIVNSFKYRFTVEVY